MPMKRALPLIAGIFAGVFAPPVPMPPSAWAAQFFMLPDGEQKGKLIDLSKTPHLIEPIDVLGPDAPDNEIAVMKSAQSAFTTALQIVTCHSIDRDPCDMMVVQPTDGALADFNSQKLGRALESPVMKRKVRPQTAKSGTASKTYEKKFSPDCSLFLSLASSTADLRSKTIKKALCDEIDEYPDDLNNQGDPLDMIKARQISFLRSGTWKRAYFSTPTIKGASKIEQKFEAGDQRRWTMTCPHCGDQNLRFEWGPNFEFAKEPPYTARYIPRCCGSPIEGWQKFGVYQTGRWVATAPGPGKMKSYHFDGLVSPFVPWDVVAKEFVEAGNDPAKLKTFWNLTLGLPFEVRTEGPSHEAIMGRLEDYRPGHIPPQALLLCIACDVQQRGIYYEVLAIAPDRQTWVVEAGYLDGATTEHDGGAFLELTKLYHRDWPDAFGNRRRADEFGIDANYHTGAVYTWVRSHPGTKALQGRDGWGRPPLGIAAEQDIDYRGRKVKGGVKLRGVGTWPLKSTFYTYLALEPKVENSARTFPPGYCHFGLFMDEIYFKQITAEYLADEVVRGRRKQFWKTRGHAANHFLDCRIYNMALADPWLAAFTSDDWARLAKDRGVPEDMRAPDLFAPRAFAAADPAPAAPPPQIAQRDPFARLSALNKGVQ